MKVITCLIITMMLSMSAKASYEMDISEYVAVEFPMIDFSITGDNLTIGKCTIKLSESMEDDDLHSDTKHFIKTKCL